MSASPDLKSLPPQARKRIEKLESTVSELTGALGQVVSEMQRQGIVIPIKRSSPLLRSLFRVNKDIKPKARRRPGFTVKKSAQQEVEEGARGHIAAKARLHGEAAKVDWMRSGEVVSAKVLADRWGLTPQALGPAAERGEVFAVVVKRHRYYPKEFLDLGRDDVSAVCRALGRMSPEEKLIFWKRPHGALAGKTVVDALNNQAGPRLSRVVQLAQSWAAQAVADAAQAS